ncbi:hypothetical protein CERSUDRAFT_42551 [Gelatoporia subvermispora B]|uniref:Fe2OG dioxygenase domain-containing protein n=1 Tax=Ceriporiopsis subvermispora (strain B) TaxID=914234 RepID=M2QYU9_CERS8|nr:hypothetical protein CERSUDRAFT_42551 [Gelatoporia subvermispora B]
MPYPVCTHAKVNCSRIDLLNATEEELQDLAQGCEPATFGKGGEDVLDETYRKSGKLDVTSFATNFHPQSCGLLSIVRGDLLEGDRERPIQAELYKLNVYGPGSFFRPHRDTPRSRKMFGSLVLVFPASHEGGELKLRHAGEEWTFDPAAALSKIKTPCIGYVAFFSDVEHEVLPVQSGHRVTVTYNLYFADDPDASLSASLGPAVRDPPANEVAFRTELASLLEDQSFLPEGGTVGFGLRHQYPFDKQHPAENNLDELRKRLKGSDAMLLQACDALGLEASFSVVYKLFDGIVLLDKIVSIPEVTDDDSSLVPHLVEECGGRLLDYDGWDETYYEKCLPVTWATPYTGNNEMISAYAYYGNEPDLSLAYIYVCLTAKASPVSMPIKTQISLRLQIRTCPRDIGMHS